MRCELKEAHLTGKDVWKVKFHAFAPGARGHLHLDYHAYTGELLRIDEKIKDRDRDRDRDRDDWDDDDDGRGHGRGRGKKKGHSKHDDD
ncbi:putative lipoprotein [Archangium gephyra]|uniref:Lipoprotein n=1 Tax=Archangium gephyra TaxID=48 RepID=A0AAC8QGK8_9BACT|nr:putative lipoprotein [Archangium gephyra]